MAKGKRRGSNIKSILIGFLIVIVSLGVLSFPILKYYFDINKGWVLKASDYTVTGKEYKYNLVQLVTTYQYFYGSGFWMYYSESEQQELAESISVNSLDAALYDETCYKEAVKAGITLTEEEKADALENIVELKKVFTNEIFNFIGITESGYVRLMEKIQLAQKYRDSIYDTYVFDQADYDEYFENYYVGNYTTINTLMAEYIVVDSLETAATVRALIDNGLEFNNLITRYDVNADSRADLESVKVSSDSFSKEIAERAFLLEAGDISDPIINSEDQYIIFKITDKQIREKEEVKQETISTYEDEKKEELMQEKYESLIKSLNIKYNPTLLNEIPVF